MLWGGPLAVEAPPNLGTLQGEDGADTGALTPRGVHWEGWSSQPPTCWHWGRFGGAIADGGCFGGVMGLRMPQGPHTEEDAALGVAPCRVGGHVGCWGGQILPARGPPLCCGAAHGR